MTNRPLSYHHSVVSTVLLTCLSTLFLSACNKPFLVTRVRPAELDLRDFKRVAVYEIAGEDGPALESAITQGLVQAGRFEVLERSALPKIKAEYKSSNDAAFVEELRPLAKLLPASALVFGKVINTNYHESMGTRSSTCSVQQGNKLAMVPCTMHVRTGVVTYIADIRVVNLESGSIMVARALQSSKTASVEAQDGQPGPVDAMGLLVACRTEAADQFMHMVASYTSQEPVDLESDGDAKELELGNRYLRAGDQEQALIMYREAVDNAESNPLAKPMTKARAHYGLGLGLALGGDYATALTHIKEANRLSGDARWLEFETRVKQWAKEAERLEAQKSGGPIASSKLGSK